MVTARSRVNRSSHWHGQANRGDDLGTRNEGGGADSETLSHNAALYADAIHVDALQRYGVFTHAGHKLKESHLTRLATAQS